uniref:Uncharacterized protein n=1 Tax=Setaria viridis TaxID=4556 RepID=A0A4U6U7F0_SETVI|nr:hypothetical protein SEVIR_6G145020v2 [Setaria viridis]
MARTHSSPIPFYPPAFSLPDGPLGPFSFSYSLPGPIPAQRPFFFFPHPRERVLPSLLGLRPFSLHGRPRPASWASEAPAQQTPAPSAFFSSSPFSLPRGPKLQALLPPPAKTRVRDRGRRDSPAGALPAAGLGQDNTSIPSRTRARQQFLGRWQETFPPRRRAAAPSAGRGYARRRHKLLEQLLLHHPGILGTCLRLLKKEGNQRKVVLTVSGRRGDGGQKRRRFKVCRRRSWATSC